MVRRPSPKRSPIARAGKRPPRARLEVDERRAQLLALGLAMFSERSYDEVSVDELARAAGVSKGLLYHYFPTKRDLYVEALAFASRQLLDETLAAPEVAPDERVRHGLETYFDFVERHGPAYAALMHGGVGSDPEVAAILEQTRGAFAARIVEGLPRAAVRPLLRITLRGWIGFVEATSLDWLAHRRVRRADLVTLLAGVLFDALARATGGAVPVVAPPKPRARRA